MQNINTIVETLNNLAALYGEEPSAEVMAVAEQLYDMAWEMGYVIDDCGDGRNVYAYER